VYLAGNLRKPDVPVRIILARLDASKRPEDMDLPGLRLHPLKGEGYGFWAVDASGNWRVFFRVENVEWSIRNFPF
jgi:proteic killer suppression protein